MTNDIFEQKILCNKCDVKMKPCVLIRNGAQLRAVKCAKCGNMIVHPADLNASQKFNDLKGKTYSVKLRMVGNSHAISIPKEIFDFMNSMNSPHNQMKRQMDEMVKLCLRDFNSLSLNFGNELNRESEEDGEIEEEELEEDELEDTETEKKNAREINEMGDDR